MTDECDRKLKVFNFAKFVDKLHREHIDEEIFSKFIINREKINYLLENDLIADEIDSLLKRFEGGDEDKSIDIVNISNEGGNCNFDEENKYDALNLYAKELLENPFNESKNNLQLLSTLYSPSDSLLAVNGYKQKIACIEEVIKLTANKSQLSKLNSVRDEYRNALSLQEKHNKQINALSTVIGEYRRTFFDIKPTPASEHNLASCEKNIRQKETNEKGRFLITDCDLPRNQIILIEQPFASVLDVEHVNEFCSNCLKLLGQKSIPCKLCSNVKFCSLNCFQIAFKLFHQYECKYNELLSQTGVLRLSLRIVLKVEPEIAIQIANETNFGRKLPPSSPASHYVQLLNLIEHGKKMSIEISIRQALVAYFYLHLIATKLKLLNYIDKNDEKEKKLILGSLLLKHIQQISVNSVSIFYQPIHTGPLNFFYMDSKNSIIGNGLYLTASLINHSCLPNSDIYYYGSTIQVRNCTPIAANDEINISYIQTFEGESRCERKAFLAEQYFFDCHCQACNWSNSELESNSYLLADALICSNCNGPLIIEQLLIGKCLHCEYIMSEESVRKITNIIDEIRKSNHCTFTDRLQSKIREKQLQNQLNNYSKIFYKYNRLLVEFYDEQYFFYMRINDYHKARQFCEKSLIINEKIFGQRSFQCLLYELRLVCQKWFEQINLHCNQNRNRIRKKLNKKLLDESNSLIEKCQNMFKTNEINHNLVTVNSCRLRCIKECVQLIRLKSN